MLSCAPQGHRHKAWHFSARKAPPLDLQSPERATAGPTPPAPFHRTGTACPRPATALCLRRRRFAVRVRRLIVGGNQTDVVRSNSPSRYGGLSSAEPGRRRCTTSCRKGTTDRRRGMQNASQYGGSPAMDVERRRGTTVRRRDTTDRRHGMQHAVELQRLAGYGCKAPSRYDGSSPRETARRRTTATRRLRIRNAVALRRPTFCGYRNAVELQRFIIALRRPAATGDSTPPRYSGSPSADTERRRAAALHIRSTADRHRGRQLAAALQRLAICGYKTPSSYTTSPSRYGGPSPRETARRRATAARHLRIQERRRATALHRRGTADRRPERQHAVALQRLAHSTAIPIILLGGSRPRESKAGGTPAVTSRPHSATCLGSIDSVGKKRTRGRQAPTGAKACSPGSMRRRREDPG